MKKQVWGNATWFMMHVLAEKLRPESQAIIPALLHHLESVCANLPCPDCSEHASGLLATSNRGAINDRDSLRRFLFELHRRVNERLGKHTPSFDACTELYSRGRTDPVVRHFFAVMAGVRSHSKAMIYGFRRAQCLQEFAKFLDSHADAFRP
jgi:hypothetical protein